ncbi:MAG: TrmB family transcriptional regulator [Rhodomicrobium sp.]|nr:TrmB family transcriptional regulator [Rhodomicrobium sp.]
MDTKHAQSTLAGFGFSETESAAYCFLLRHPPATGYRIARGIGKAAANVYAAIESLVQKGAAMVDEGESRIVRATDPAQLFRTLSDRFERDRRAAESALAALHAPEADDRLYQIRDVDQAFAHARELAAGAQSTLLLDSFPTPLALLSQDLERAVERGVRVGLRAYDPSLSIPGAIVAVSKDAEQQLVGWPGEQLNMVADARRQLVAMFDSGCNRIVQALASDSLYLSCLLHSALVAEMSSACAGRGAADPGLTEIKSMSLLRAKPPGLAAFARLVEGTDLNNQAA